MAVPGLQIIIEFDKSQFILEDAMDRSIKKNQNKLKNTASSRGLILVRGLGMRVNERSRVEHFYNLRFIKTEVDILK